MHRRKELRPKSPDGVRQPQPDNVVRDGHDDVHRLHGQHALQNPDVPEYRKTAHVVRKYSVSIVVETDDPALETARDQYIQRKTPIAPGPHNGQPDTLI